MSIKKTLAVCGLITVFFSGALTAGQTHEVGQKNKKFTVKKMKVKVGDKVRFTNQDRFYHNVFSLSEIKSFDLGSYRRGKYKEVVFDKPGKVEVECAIHSRMRMEIEVTQ